MDDIHDKLKESMSSPLYVKPIRQEPDLCGNTVIQMYINRDGIEASIDEIGKIAGTTKESGTPNDGMEKALKHYGYETSVKEQGTLDDLRYYINRGIPVIIDWFSFDGGPGGHYSIVVDINKKNVTLRDPLFTKIRKMSIKDFMASWFDYPGDYPKDKSVFIVRWMLIGILRKTKPED